MKKQLMVGLLSAGLVVALMPGIATAAPNPDSTAGVCGLVVETNPGIGDGIAFEAMPFFKDQAEAQDLPLGEVLQGAFEESGVAWGIWECTPGRTSD
jgi:hypothetical protein